MFGERPGDRALPARRRSVDRDQEARPGAVLVVGLFAQAPRFDRGMSLWQGARNVGGGPSLHRPILHLYNWS